MTIVFLGEGAAQNGRMAETLNAAAKGKLPLLFLVIDNGRAINTFTPDVAANSDVFAQVRRVLKKSFYDEGCLCIRLRSRGALPTRGL